MTDDRNIHLYSLKKFRKRFWSVRISFCIVVLIPTNVYCLAVSIIPEILKKINVSKNENEILPGFHLFFA